MSIDDTLRQQVQSQQLASKFQAPTIHTVDDIRKVLSNLDPSSKLNAKVPDTDIMAKLTGSDGHSPQTFRVNATTVTKSYRQIIAEALQIIRNREEAQLKAAAAQSAVDVNDHRMTPPPVIATEARLYIDGIIERLLGAYRRGVLICWDLPDGTYQYDVFLHKLVKVTSEVG